MEVGKTKRFALFLDALAGGGAEKVVMALASRLVVMGHHVDLIVLNKQCDYELPTDYPVYFLYSGKKVNVKSRFTRRKHAAALTALVTRLEQNQGQYNGYFSNLDDCHNIVSACDFSPSFYVMHNSVEETLKRARLLGPIKYAYQARVFNLLNNKNLITVSQGIEQEITLGKRISANSIKTIYNPFVGSQVSQLANEVMADIPKEKYIIHVGRVAKQKRHDILFAAFKQLPQDYKLVCLSGNTKKLTKLAKKQGIQHRVICPGFQQNPYPWIKHAQALVLSSDYEGLGMVLIEALQCSTKVVATDCPHGPNEVLTGDLAEWLVPRRDSQALADKLGLLLNTEVNCLGAEIFAKVEASSVAQQYVDMCSGL